MTKARASKNAPGLEATNREEVRKQMLRRNIFVAVLIAAFVVAGYLSTRSTTGPGVEGGTAAPAGITGNTYVIGAADAPNTLFINEDFLCGHCKTFEEAASPLIADAVASGKLQVQYQPVAILNRASKGTNYPTRAAAAAASVWSQGNADVWLDFHDALFAAQPEMNTEGLSDEALASLAADAGANAEAVAADLAADEYQGWIGLVTDEASKNGMTGTPFVRWNGEIVSSEEVLQELAALSTVN